MPRWSQRLDLPGGGVAIVCGRSPSKRCKCGKVATIQCDYPVVRKGVAGTCDRHCCRSCATNVGPNRDFCPPHARLAEEERAP